MLGEATTYYVPETKRKCKTVRVKSGKKIRTETRKVLLHVPVVSHVVSVFLVVCADQVFVELPFFLQFSSVTMGGW